MSSNTAAAFADTGKQPVAPWWHTLFILAALAGLSLASKAQNGPPNAHLPGLGDRLSSYFTVMVAEWFLVLVIWLPLRRRRLSLGVLVCGRWPTLRAFFRDLAWATGFLLLAVPAVGALSYLLGAKAMESTLAHVTPKTALELVVFLFLSATAGFCEELVFRGYLARQFSAWTGSSAAGILLQGVAFGLAHGYYRWVMLAVMVLGWLLGLLAHWRRSLRPGMLAHGLQDALGGVLAFFS